MWYCVRPVYILAISKWECLLPSPPPAPCVTRSLNICQFDGGKSHPSVILIFFFYFLMFEDICISLSVSYPVCVFCHFLPIGCLVFAYWLKRSLTMVQKINSLSMTWDARFVLFLVCLFCLGLVLVLFLMIVLGVEPSTSRMLSKQDSTTELYPQPLSLSFVWDFSHDEHFYIEIYWFFIYLIDF